MLVSGTKSIMTSGASVAVPLSRALAWEDGSDGEKMLVGMGVKSSSSFTSCVVLKEFLYLSEPYMSSYVKHKLESTQRFLERLEITTKLLDM